MARATRARARSADPFPENGERTRDGQDRDRHDRSPRAGADRPEAAPRIGDLDPADRVGHRAAATALTFVAAAATEPVAATGDRDDGDAGALDGSAEDRFGAGRRPEALGEAAGDAFGRRL